MMPGTVSLWITAWVARCDSPALGVEAMQPGKVRIDISSFASKKATKAAAKAEQEAEALAAKKKRRQIIIGASAVGALAALVIATVASVYWPKSEPPNRDPAVMRSEQQQRLEKLMQQEIDRATSRGEPAAEIEAIRTRFKAEINKVSKD